MLTLREAVALMLRDAGEEGMTCPQIAEAIKASGVYSLKGKTPFNSVFGVISTFGGTGGTFRKVSTGHYALALPTTAKEGASNDVLQTTPTTPKPPPPPPPAPLPPPPPLAVRVLLIVAEGDADASADPGYVIAALVPCAVWHRPRGSENVRWGRRLTLRAGTVEGVGGWG